MSSTDLPDYQGYFLARGIDAAFYPDSRPAAWLAEVLDRLRPASVLDFGCGFGQTLVSLRNHGNYRLMGYDIEPDALAHARTLGFEVVDGRVRHYRDLDTSFDLVIMSHVLEHLPKSEMIETLRQIRGLLAPGGKLVLAVPNAQSNTGCYWAYEDFTHHTLFTAGSVLFVLRQAGYTSIEIVDPDCLSGLRLRKRVVRKAALRLFRANLDFWNWVTASSFHRPSPVVLSYEIKALASR